MRVLSPILNHFVYPVLGKAGYFRARGSAAVVTYHGVVPDGYNSPDVFLDGALISVNAFRSQIRLLKRNYDVISPEDFRRWVVGQQGLPPRAVLLTCDDGLLNNQTVMLPVLKQEDVECLFFVTGASVSKREAMLWYIELYLMLLGAQKSGEVNWRGIHVAGVPSDPERKRVEYLRLVDDLSRWNAEDREAFLKETASSWGIDRDWRSRYLQDPLLRQRFQLLESEHLCKLVDAGMTLGAHTISHPVLSRQPDDLARKEISESRQELAKATGSAVWALAYPYGNPNATGAREIQFAKEDGYSCAFMNVPGDLMLAGKFSLPRVHVTADMNIGSFEANISGFHESVRRRMRPAPATNVQIPAR